MSTIASREYLRTYDAANYLGVSEKYLEMARCRGTGPIYCKAGRLVIYKRSDLDAFMSANRQSDTTGTKAAVAGGVDGGH